MSIIPLLISHGADVTIKDNRGNDAFDYIETHDVENKEALIQMLHDARRSLVGDEYTVEDY